MTATLVWWFPQGTGQELDKPQGRRSPCPQDTARLHRQQFQRERRPRPDTEGDPPASAQRCINLRPQAGNRTLIQQKTLGMDFSLQPFPHPAAQGAGKGGQHLQGWEQAGRRDSTERVGAALAVENRVQTPLLPSPVSSDASPQLTQPQSPETSPCCAEWGSLSRPVGSTAAMSQHSPECRITPLLPPCLLGRGEIQIQLGGGGGSDRGKVSFAVVQHLPGTLLCSWHLGRRLQSLVASSTAPTFRHHVMMLKQKNSLGCGSPPPYSLWDKDPKPKPREELKLQGNTPCSSLLQRGDFPH